MKKAAAAVGCLLLALAAIPLWAAPQYKIIDLGLLPGFAYGGAEDINDAGQVIGSIGGKAGEDSRGFIWTEKTGMVAPAVAEGLINAGPVAINNLGQIVGNGSGRGTVAVVWSPDGTVKTLNETAHVKSINDLGQAAGENPQGACIWEADGTRVDLGGFSNRQGWACDINNHGRVVGSAGITNGDLHGFIWTRETGMVDIGLPFGATNVFPSAVNDAGDIAGFVRTVENHVYGVLWKADGTTINLTPNPPGDNSMASDLNERGQVVGTVNNRPVLWDSDGTLVKLEDLSGSDYGRATGINNRGWISGLSFDGNNNAHAVIWKPASTSVEIDIKPGDSTNVINLKSKGTTPAAVLGEEGFDVKTIDVSTITLADAPVKTKPNGKPMASYEDVNGDGSVDLLLHFSTQSLKLSSTGTSACLTGQCYDGSGIEGTDAVAIL